MIVSIIFPSRSRLHSKSRCLLNFIESIESTINDPNDVEILIKVDDDDTEQIKVCEDLKQLYSHIEYFITPRGNGYFDSSLHYNYLAEKTKGTFIAMWTDDFIIKTLDWDKLLYNYIDKTTYILNSQYTGTINLFPIVHRRFYELIGHCGLWPLDWFWDVFNGYYNIYVPIPMKSIHVGSGYADECQGGNSGDQRNPGFNMPEANRVKSILEAERNRIRLSQIETPNPIKIVTTLPLVKG